MFQYSRETILNSAYDSDGVTSKLTADLNNLWITRNITIKENNLASFQKIAYKAAAITVAEAQLSGLTNTDLYRVNVTVGLVGNVEASYANDLTYSGKPILVEFYGNDATAATNLVAAINKSLIANKFVIATVGSSTKLVLTGTNPYQKFTSFIIEKYTARTNGGNTTYEGTWATALTATETTAPFPGFGTYDYLVNNITLRTMEKVNPFAINIEESPIPGNTYDLYVVNINSGPRNIGGFGVVGEVSNSVTAHKFWVNKNIVPPFLVSTQGAAGVLDLSTLFNAALTTVLAVD